MAGKTIEAAGGIVLRKGAKLIAVVQRSKDDAWVLPRGKLKRDENPAAAARREVVEETGHRVELHEYLGAITYRAGRRPKVVEFWRMEADPEPSHELMPDIVAVDWLPLKAAIRRLSYPLEKLFLRHAIARALKKRRLKKTRKAKATGSKPAGFKPAPSGKAAKPRKSRRLEKSAVKKGARKAAAKAIKPHRNLKQIAKDARAARAAKDRDKRNAKDKKKRRKPKKKGKR